MAYFKDITGQRSGRLVAVEMVGRHGPKGVALWRCQCDCGGEKIVQGRLLGPLSGVRSCGCLLLEFNRSRPVRASTNKTHGESGGKSGSRTTEYTIWHSMRQRCGSPSHSNYPDYGGRGIRVCEAWESSYEQFLKDVGRRPSKAHTLDRIDTDGHYEPGNVRWTTWGVQQNNRRDTKTAIIHGQLLKATEIARLHGVSERTVHNWISAVGQGGDITEKLEHHKPLSRPSVAQGLHF